MCAATNESQNGFSGVITQAPTLGANAYIDPDMQQQEQERKRREEGCCYGCCTPQDATAPISESFFDVWCAFCCYRHCADGSLGKSCCACCSDGSNESNGSDGCCEGDDCCDGCCDGCGDGCCDGCGDGCCDGCDFC